VVNTSVAIGPADWRTRAACRDVDPDLFFPVATGGSSLAQEARALAVCRTCRVTVDCLRFAMAHAERDGIWGGTTADDRNTASRNLTRGAA
jgi:WhiB family transcriptional regulator, redox-sensing transcriptional regulator